MKPTDKTCPLLTIAYGYRAQCEREECAMWSWGNNFTTSRIYFEGCGLPGTVALYPVEPPIEKEDK